MKLGYKQIGNEFNNVKEILKTKFQISNRLLAKLKKDKHIFLNNVPCYVTAKTNPNDIILVDLDFEEKSDNIIPTEMDLDIIFEDEALLVINKPAGITIHPSQNHYTDSLSNGVKFYYNTLNLKRKIRPVNRLDKDTSGIVIFAKNEYIQEALIKQMKEKVLKKEYIAFIEGFLNTMNGTISVPIARKEGSIIEREVSKNGEIAITHFEVLKKFKNYTKLKYTLETGRTHQLRVHSKYLGNPILGDTLYGNKSNKINRQALHAYKISFIHPISKKKMIFITELPQDMKNLN